MQISVKTNVQEFTRKLNDVEKKQMPFATALALTRTAKEMQNVITGEIPKVFDRPTPYTRRSIYMRPAKKSNLSAEVGVADKPTSSKATPPVKFFAPEIFGGKRRTISRELKLQRKGLIDSYLVPSHSLTKDTHGNITLAKLTKILKAAEKSEKAFIGSPGGGRLPLGVWQRLYKRKIKPLFIAVQSIDYGPRFHFYKIANAVFGRVFKRQFELAFKEAMTTAK